MSQTIRRVQGGTGNPITGILNNKDGSLTIPAATPVTVSGRRIDTGELIINASPVTISNYTTRAFSYAPATNDWETPCTMRLQFKIAMTNGKPVYVPDDEDRFELLLEITPRVGT